MSKVKKIHEWLTEEMWIKGHNFITTTGETADGYVLNLTNICGCCLSGALLLKTGNNMNLFLVDDKKIQNKLNIYDWAVDWNDLPERTFDDVITLCRELDI